MQPPALTLYNTLTRTKEPFSPLVEGEVRMYVCGPTVYDLSHLGHARKEVVFDVMVRYLRFRGFRVQYIRNITDVDDKIIVRAKEAGVSWEQIAREFEQAFQDDMDVLGVMKPDQEPRATETIAEMQEIIQMLLDKQFAYVSEGSVYFAVEALEDYGKLTHRKAEEMMAGARVEVDESKRNPLDFALWKASKPGEPSWPSPWGEGRPGWHIECSAMSRKFLGETLDIHGGGVDLVFPHHENEIAQSEAATGKPFARWWVHNGLLTVEKEKMAKSLGNYITIRDALCELHPETLRMFFLSHHYRSPVDFSKDAVGRTKKNLDYFYNTLLRIEEICGKEDEPPRVGGEGTKQTPPEGMEPGDLETVRTIASRFQGEMDDDLNTAGALGELFRAATVLNRWIDEGDPVRSEEGKDVLQAFRRELKEIGRVLGLFRENPLPWFQQISTPEQPGGADLSDEAIEAMMQQRETARKEKDWATADQIRDELASRGIGLEDTPHGTRWKRNA
jgi:cysteinyl-tRNA synthetase